MTTHPTSDEAPSINDTTAIFEAIRLTRADAADDRAAGLETLIFIAGQGASQAMRSRARSELARLGCVWRWQPYGQTDEVSAVLENFGPDFWREARA